MVIDSQCHVSPVWYEPAESLLQQMVSVGVQQAVLIQMLGQTDNAYQQECVERFPDRFVSVVLVDPTSVDAVSRLRTLAAEGATGIRLRPGARTPGSDPLALWRCAAECNLAVSCVGTTESFAAADFATLIGDHPGLTVVLEHLGGTSTPDQGRGADERRRQMLSLAKFPNLYLKVPGLGELMSRKMPPPSAGNPFEDGRPAVLSDALAAFGPQRLMWGSDFPPVCAREGYANALELCRRSLSDLSEADQADIFGNVARRVFKLPVVPR